ncbi:MAG: hypothetical protein JWQ90_655 [Hydrocarboniphaga sp.]|uniref:CHAT domain-containing protein n=1 Tax=Hydrocarboniphaga sp. TaxID=2033016 RepID=UPI0026294946|nr:CHAT domain-containing protein [Hydrocarboniphaga sp.]MDB5968205.1 hypothetical protein [Hydrocarboniphaga sp.]
MTSTPLHRRRTRLPAWIAGLLLCAGTAQAANDTSSVTAALDRQADADSLQGIAAEGALLYDAEAVKQDGYAYCGQSVALSERGEFRLSVRAASKALHVALATGNDDLQALANRDLAIAYSYSGNLDQAERFATEALKHKPKDPPVVFGPAHKILGDVYSRRGDYAKAVASYEAADKASSDRFRPLVKTSLANTLVDSGDLARARSVFAEVPTQQDPTLRNQLLRTSARLLTAEKKPEEAIALYETLAATRDGGDPAYLRLWAQDGIARNRLAQGDKTRAARAWDAATDDADQVRAEFRSEEIKMGLFSDVQGMFENAIELYIDMGDARRAFDLSERSRSRALLDAVRGRGPVDAAATIDSKTLQAALRPDERVLEFHALRDELIAWIIAPNEIRAVRLPLPRSDLIAVVEAFRNSIIGGKRSAVSGAEQIGVLLLKPLQLEAGTRLIIVPHGPLHYLPFQALRLNDHYLIEDHRISIAPSSTIATQLAQRPVHARHKLVAFGNPLIEAKYDLPGSEGEVKAVSGYFDDKSVYLRADATKAHFREASAGAGIVHVAAHAMADFVDPLYSRILLANENGKQSFLEAHEVLAMKLEGVDVVTLSACESGLGKIASGDETLGFTRSFLSAGSSSLIASLWPVSDDAAELLMTTLYRDLAGGADLQSAMQDAQLAVLRNPKMAHPFFWAPFNLIGNWRLTVKQ